MLGTKNVKGLDVMPCISMFYRLLVYMYWYDDKEHKLPHVHVKYQDYQAIFAIADAKLLSGKLLE